MYTIRAVTFITTFSAPFVCLYSSKSDKSLRTMQRRMVRTNRAEPQVMEAELYSYRRPRKPRWPTMRRKCAAKIKIRSTSSVGCISGRSHWRQS